MAFSIKSVSLTCSTCPWLRFIPARQAFSASGIKRFCRGYGNLGRSVPHRSIGSVWCADRAGNETPAGAVRSSSTGRMHLSEHLRFEELVLPHLDAGHNLARWLARDPHDAEDVV